MKKYNILAHTCFIGETGYANHSRLFFTALNKYHNVKVRNFTVGKSWQNYTQFEHDKEFYITDEHRNMLIQQTLWNADGSRSDYSLYNYKDDFIPDIHIVLEEVNQHYFYDDYDGYKIAYTVWESTKYPEQFFNKLLQYDELWVPSEWQKECSIKQGYPPEKIKVIIEGVDIDIFKPIEIKKKENKFKFLLFGRWEYRKSTKEIIKAFNETFSKNEPVELICSINNEYANDNFTSSKDRLNYYKLNNKNIKLLDFLSRKDYIKYLQNGNVFLSCARSEGWNLPLIEAMSCGTPSIYSNWGAQLQFAKNKGIPIDIIGEKSANIKIDDRWFSNSIGNYCEPDFNHLKKMMREVYNNYNFYKENAMKESIEIHNNFNWDAVAKMADNELQKIDEYKNDFIFVACGNLNYMSLLEKLTKSIFKFSKRKILIYGINCDVPFDYPNLIKKRINLNTYSKYDKWYWKQQVCIESLKEDFEHYVWVDGDIIVNYNIDNIENYFNYIENYPIADIHIQEEFLFRDDDGNIQLFNEKLIEYNNNTVKKSWPYSHICLYVYNKKCKWWFDEILDIYKSTDLEKYSQLYVWNDEGIDNFLRWKYKFNKFLPLSNFDVSSYDGDSGFTDNALNHFYTFWNESGPKNFNMIYGWQFIPKNKNQILYFHGNKDLNVCDRMIEFIEFQKNNNFHNSHFFYTKKYELKNLGSINGVCGSTIDIANKYGWDFAIYHEIFNLKDYYYKDFIKIKKGDTVVDLGANIGVFSRFAHIEGAEKIISFEPDIRYFNLLKLNSHKSSILFNAAISNNIGYTTLTESSHLGGSHILHSNGLGLKKYKVKTYTLDYLFETGLIDKIDLLKVDIEGAEIMAMEGISDENLLKVNQISMEYHHAHLNYNEALRHNLIIRLNNLGFNSYTLFCGNDNALQLLYFWRE